MIPDGWWQQMMAIVAQLNAVVSSDSFIRKNYRICEHRLHMLRMSQQRKRAYGVKVVATVSEKRRWKVLGVDCRL